ncbi:MAG: hypothetical protein VYE31_01860 [Pseudomonadota bacterium]|nr:hypothetical protein [Pseudomonadota bacterium]
MNNFKTSTYLIFFTASLLLYVFYDFSKVHFLNDNYFGFYPILGFVSCIALIFIAKFLSYFLERDDKYYDD